MVTSNDGVCENVKSFRLNSVQKSIQVDAVRLNEMEIMCLFFQIAIFAAAYRAIAIISLHSFCSVLSTEIF